MSDYIGINTDRLLLRSIRPDDAIALFKYRSDAVINKYQGWIPKTIDDVYDFTDLDKHIIIAYIDPENIKSIALVERIGFRKDPYTTAWPLPVFLQKNISSL